MNTSHLFKSKISTMIPDYQQQSGHQKSFDISFNPYLHPLHVQSASSNNSMFASNPFQRSFASVVSCKQPVLQRSSDTKVRGLINSNGNGILNTFLKKIVYSSQKRGAMLPPKPFFESSAPSSSSSHVQKEFEDFNTLPSYLQQQNQRVKSHNNNNSSNNTMPSHPSSNKNRHAKQRHSIEHDIRVDCDIFNIKKVNNNNNNIKINSSCGNKATMKSLSCLPSKSSSCENSSDPPFEIYSLEEFPAIPTRVTSHDQQKEPSPATVAATKQQQEESDEGDFVKFHDTVVDTTPTFIPRRFNICEKVTNIVKNSPKKFLNIPMMSPRRSCLKPSTSSRRRTVSECSDDYIVFDRSCCDEDDIDNFDEDMECDEETEDEDSDMSDNEDEAMAYSEDDDECDGNHEASQNSEENFEPHQPDSGMEEKRVHFSLVPKVHVMIAWDYAYRQARRGDAWRQSAVDRERFATRISKCGEALNPILEKSHRARIFEDRFRQQDEKVNKQQTEESMLM